MEISDTKEVIIIIIISIRWSGRGGEREADKASTMTHTCGDCLNLIVAFLRVDHRR